jgi:PAS domain S-box-containing protein
MKVGIKSFFSTLLDIRSSDPDDARRRKLLSIFLLGVGILTGLTLISLAVATVIYGFGGDINGNIWLGTVGLFIGFIVFFWANRNSAIPGWITSGVFLVFLLGIFLFVDTPEELAGGRSLFVFTVPIIMSSILLRPSASFLFAGIGSLEIWYLATLVPLVPNTFGMAGFFLLALVSWLSARSLELALKDLRVINAELDQRVADRTQELSDSLTREAQQASQRQAILQGIADGVMVFDLRGVVILTNPALTRLLELPLDLVLQKNLGEVLQTPQISENDRELILKSLGINESTLAPIRIKWGRKTISIIAAPVRDAKGQILGNVAVMRDFTREAEVEEMKNAFVAMVSHELRTPLNAILGYSEMLRDAFYGPVNEKQVNAADRILRNSRRLLDIVSDLLDQARIEAGQLKFKRETFKTIELTNNLHSVMDKIAQDKRLELVSQIESDMPDEITGDAQRLQQVLVNLANNAVKFTEKGTVKVSIYKATDKRWAFDVADTGRGISPEDQKYIFDPFRQVDGTATRSQGGIGLGLAIVKRLVELMGGRIFIKSALGQGSVFTVILPFEPPKKEG